MSLSDQHSVVPGRAALTGEVAPSGSGPADARRGPRGRRRPAVRADEQWRHRHPRGSSLLPSPLLACLALVAALAGCARTTETAPPSLDLAAVLGGPAEAGFARALAPRDFTFPADHGPHPEFRSEWWYYTGNLATDAGRPFGFQLTFFRTSLAPPTADPTRASAWATPEVWMAHLAVSDPEGGRFYACERFARQALGLAGAEADPFAVWLGSWEARNRPRGRTPTQSLGRSLAEQAQGGGRSEAEGEAKDLAGATPDPTVEATQALVPGMERVELAAFAVGPTRDCRPLSPNERPGEAVSGDPNPSPAHRPSSSPQGIELPTDAFGLALALEPRKAATLQGDRGLSQKGDQPGNASLYYSLTRLGASGEITAGGRRYAVTGTAWLDREWSTSALSADEVGWDWFALQLDDGSELMLYQLRRRDGTISPHSSGSWIAPAADQAADHSPGTSIAGIASSGRIERGANSGLGATGSMYTAGDTAAATAATPTAEQRRAVAQTLAAGDFRLEASDLWTSPRGGRYPARWRISVPSADIALEVVPRLADQELAVSLRYWEGAVTVQGRVRGAPVSGVGYVELTGYAESR
jgi:predicted secreted hydrolase